MNNSNMTANTHNQPYIIGIGPGRQDFIYPLAAKLIAQAEVLIGGRRNLAELAKPGQETMVIDRGLAAVADYISQNWQSRRIVVLASGDTSLFSVRAYLQKRLPKVPFAVLPGISSLQYLLARRGLNLNELKIITLHGKNGANLLNTVMRERATAIFTGGENSPQAIAGRLAALDFAQLTLTVGENLSYPDERVTTGTPQEIAAGHFADLSLMLVENANPGQRPWPYLPAGLPDDVFGRTASVPMTKSEVRAIISSKLRLEPASRLLEVGAGTGSVTVEAALAAYDGHVWALEKDATALAVCRANIDRFGLDNITLVEGTAPEAIPEEAFDRVFIGGSGGGMAAIIARVLGQSGRYQHPLRVVMSAITVESVSEALCALQAGGCQNIEIVQASVARSRAAGRKHLMMALNPITIIAADYGI